MLKIFIKSWSRELRIEKYTNRPVIAPLRGGSLRGRHGRSLARWHCRGRVVRSPPPPQATAELNSRLGFTGPILRRQLQSETVQRILQILDFRRIRTCLRKSVTATLIEN